MEQFLKITSLPRKSQRIWRRGDVTIEPMTKLKDIENEQEDRISNLPDSILTHILSFLPMEDAVKTVLLQRFGNLWNSVQNLEFDGRSCFTAAGASKWFTEFVDRVLLLHDCPSIFRFSLKFGSYLYFLPKTVSLHNQKPLKQELADKLNSWIDFAVRKKVKILDLAILAYESSSSRFDYDLPDIVLASDSLVELKLVNISWNQGCPVNMKLLKMLSLTTIMMDDEMIEGILSGCPVMESLSLIKCYGFRKLNCTSVHLKNLVVDVGENELTVALEISGPNLTSLHLSGAQGSFDLRNLSSLVEAFLDLCCESIGGTHISFNTNIGKIFESLNHANVFTITSWGVLVLSLWETAKIACPSSSHKCIILKTALTKWHLLGISNLLRNTRHLETLCICIEADATATDSTVNDLIVGIPGTYENRRHKRSLFGAFTFNEDEYLNAQHSFMIHLKTVKIFSYVLSPYLLKLVKFLLRCSNVLEEMVISAKWSGELYDPTQSVSKELRQFCRKLSKYPKASERAVIRFT